MQLSDVKLQLEEAHRQHEHMVRALKLSQGTSSFGAGGAEGEERGRLLEQQMDAMRAELALALREAEAQAEAWRERAAEVEAQMRNANQDHSLKATELSEQLKELEL